MAMYLLADFFSQFGIALCVMASMITVAIAIDTWLIKRHSFPATIGFVLTLIVGGLVFGSAIHFLV
jgi:hypothetical protein